MDREEKLNAILDAVHGNAFTTPKRDYSWHVLNEYSDDLLSRLLKALETKEVDRLSAQFLLQDKYTEANLSQVIWFTPKVFKKDGSFKAYGCASMINGLYRYDVLPQLEDYSTANKKVRDQCISIIKVQNAMLDHGDSKTLPMASAEEVFTEQWITDARIVHLVTQSTKTANLVIKLIKKHKRCDFGFLDAKINGGNLPLSEGVL